MDEVDLATITPEQLAEQLGIPLEAAARMVAISRGEWAGDVYDEAGPVDRGDRWPG